MAETANSTLVPVVSNQQAAPEPAPTRRNIFAAIPAISGVALLLAAPQKAQARPSPEDRMAFHLSEFKKAFEEVEPGVSWCGGHPLDYKSYGSTALVLMAHRNLFEGDGLYRVLWEGRYHVFMRITATDQYTPEGDRLHELEEPTRGRKVWMAGAALNNIIQEKVSA